MSILKKLQSRSGSACELCGSGEELDVYEIPPKGVVDEDSCIFVCKVCSDQLENSDDLDLNHWRCLNDSIWSEVVGVKVVAWRILDKLRSEVWPQDLLDMLYLEEVDLEWAGAMKKVEEDENQHIEHRDVNGVVLQAGDSVVLIKDLKVKGSSMVAKQGTAVRRISLDPDNEEYIEGKVNGSQIVIITKYVKKLT